MQAEPNLPDFPATDDERRAYFLGQTARLSWEEIAPFFARGQVVWVAETLDLIEVALALAVDDAPQLRRWMAADHVAVLDTATAKVWVEVPRELWAVVVQPWVLVQARTPMLSMH